VSKKSLLGKHPPEMALLAVVEICQRFALWGIANLLVLYLLQSQEMSAASADRVFGIFTGAAFILPLLGGYIADHWDYHKAVFLGCILTALGCFLMAIDSLPLVYLALVSIALGGCLFTPSIYTLLGNVYRDKHNLREAGFSIYYAAVNIGVFLALVIMGALGNAGKWHVAFALAGIIQIAGLVPLRIAFRRPALLNAYQGNRFHMHMAKGHEPLSPREKRRMLVICILALFSILFWLSYNQGGSSLTVFALHYTNRHLGKFEIPPSWMLSLESLYLIILAVPLASLYMWLAKRRRDPSPPMKVAYSLFAMSICFLIMTLGASSVPAGAKAAAISPFYLVFAYIFMAIGEMLQIPIGLALVTHLSPPRFTAFLVGVWYVCIGIAFYLGGEIAAFMASITHLNQFFLLFVFSTLIPGMILAFLSRKLNKMRHLESL
jgi:POT family proton-dependent oligopeptide transporter